MYRFFAIFFAAILLISGPSFHASAQVAPEDPDTYRGVESPELNKYASDDDLDMKDGYGIPTLKNLSKLYWSLAMFDLGDNEAVDNYLMINECDLYLKYFSSDFEFESLREATKETIVKNMASFPVKFEIMIPVGFDRYDTGTEKFKLDPESHFVGAKRLEIYVNDAATPVCARNKVSVEGYPKNFILSLSRPFTITEVPVPPELAQFYIEESQKLVKMYPYRYTISKHGRLAYIRLKVTMNQFRGYSQQTGQAPMADIFGTIDGYEVYADREKTLLLYKQESQVKKVYRRKKVSQAVQSAPVETPAAASVPPIEDSVQQQPY